MHSNLLLLQVQLLGTFHLMMDTYRQHRKLVAQYLGAAPRRMKTEKILTLLTESGCMYLLFYVSFSYLPLF
jgi:hypothetical protein